MWTSVTRMKVVQFDAERFAPLKIVEETCIRLFGLFGIGLGKVHEV
jgi:hypothetical protein